MKRRRRRSRRMVKLLFVLACVSCFLCGFRFGGTKTVAMTGKPESKESQLTEMKTVEPVANIDTAENRKETLNETLQGQRERKKYYTCIVIEAGDSLYGIAANYMSDEYESADQYISEIKKINGMISNDLEQGEYLTIPYYNYV